jgi:hypothetical protein
VALDTVAPLAILKVGNGDTTNGGRTMRHKTYDLGNNESAKVGVFPQRNGTFLALTFSASKTFKTRKGAERWLARRIG